MILYALIGLVLASFVFAFLSAKTWHWGYVVLVEAVFLSTLLFYFLAAETLRINGALRNQIKANQTQLDNLVADNEALRIGTQDGTILNRLRNTDPPTKIAEDATSLKSLETLDHELLIATRNRGRVWHNVVPAGPLDLSTGAIRVTFTAPRPAPAPAADAATAETPAPTTPAPTTPAAAPAAAAPVGLKANTVVYLFEDGPPQAPAANGAPRGPQFLGEFNVTQAAGQQATLQPVQPLGPNDLETRRLAASRGPWLMYETMPMDRDKIYAGMTEDALKQLLPQQSVKEYVRDGKEATTDDDPWRKVGFDESGKPVPPEEIGKAAKVIYQRRLRDYAAEFDEFTRRRIAMLAEIDAVQKDIKELTAAEEVATKLQALRTDERQKLTSDLAGITKEREAIQKHLDQVQQLLAKARELTAQAIARNHQLAAELAARQLHKPAPGGPGSSVQKPEPLALDRAK